MRQVLDGVGSDDEPTPSPFSPAMSGSGALRFLGDYELLEFLAEGATGRVYRARQVSAKRELAVKVLHQSCLASTRALRRFRNEFEVVARLNHPHILPVYEPGDDGGVRYFGMRLAVGGSVADALKRGDWRPLPQGQDRARQEAAARLLCKIANAVHHAHQRGVIHRDLKPGNILLDETGEPLVGDFGLAKALDDDSGLTLSSEILGTPAYMAPEQLDGGDSATVSSDIYSLGAVLYELVTQVPPFHGRSVDSMFHQIRSVDPAPPSRHHPAVDRGLGLICLKCLRKDPAERYETASALARELQAWWSGEPISAKPQTSLERIRSWAGRNRALALATTSAVASLLIGLTVSVWQWRSAAAAARTARDALSEANAAYAWSDRHSAERHLELGESGLGLAYLARAIQRDPSNHVGVGRLVSALAYHPLAVPGPVLRHHGELVQAVFSEDSRLVATASGDRTAVVWDASTGSVVAGPFAHQGLVRCLAFDGEGKFLVTSSDDGWIQAFDMETAARRPLLHAPGAPSYALFHRHGTEEWLALGPKREACIAWSGLTRQKGSRPGPHTPWVLDVMGASAGAPMEGATAHSALDVWDEAEPPGQGDSQPSRSRATAVAMDPRGVLVCVGQGDGSLVAWSRNNRAVAWRVVAHRRRINAVTFSRDGERIAVASEDHSSTVWTRDGRLGPRVSHAAMVASLAFSPDGRRLVTGSDDSTARVWDTNTGSKESQELVHGGLVRSVAFSPDGLRVVTASSDRTARIWEFRPPTPTGLSIENPAWVGTLATDATGSRLAVGSADGAVSVIAPRTGRAILPAMKHAGGMNQTVFSRSGALLVTGSRQGELSVWETGTGGRRFTRIVHGREGQQTTQQIIKHVAISPDEALVASGAEDGRAVVLRADTGEPVGDAVEHPWWVTAIQFWPRGDRWITACADGKIRLWPLRGRRTPLLTWGHGDAVGRIVLSSDGSRLWSASNDGTACVWDTTTGARIGEPARHGSWVFDLAISPDERLYATGSRDHTAGIWEASTGKPVCPLIQHAAPVIGVCFAAHGRMLFTGCLDGTVRLWNVETGDAMGEPLRPGSTVEGIIADPAGAWVACRDGGGRARVWRLPVNAPGDVPALTSVAVALGGYWLGPDGHLQQAASSLNLESLNDALIPALQGIPGSQLELYERVGDAARTESHWFPDSPCLDLRPHFNARLEDDWQNPADRGNNLGLLGRGKSSLAGIPWRIQGLIQLASREIDRVPTSFPARVGPIPVGGTCSALHFLHGAGWEDTDGTVVARYIVSYRDGHQEEIPVRYGVEIAGWQYRVDAPSSPAAEDRVAWRGTQLRWAADPRLGIRLYALSWRNPRPEAEIERLELVSAHERSAVFIVAISATR